MSGPLHRPEVTRLSGEDLTFWWVDSPAQPTTMAMLMVLDRAPDAVRLGAAFERAVAAVPRLTERVVEAPLGISLPHWEADPTFDLDYHVRRHKLAGPADLEELLHEITPTYETPFDRSRPLWEARIYDGLGPAVGVLSAGPACGPTRTPEASGGREPSADGPLPARTPDPSSGALRRVEASGGRDGSLGAEKSAGRPGAGKQSALFFKLHHAVADGVGGNAIFAAMTDAERDPADAAVPAPAVRSKGCWAEPAPFGQRLLAALRERVALDVERARTVTGSVIDTLRHPAQLGTVVRGIRSLVESATFDSHSPLKRASSRAWRLSATALPFAEVRRIKAALGGAMIDVILTVMARAMGQWYAAHRMRAVREVMTLVPVNLRKPEEWAARPHTGNIATGILVPLPIRIRDPLATYREIHVRMEAKKADPLSTATPALAEWLSVMPRQVVTWMAAATSGNIDFIVTNVPGILVPRYLAGAEILAAYPFAPVAVKSPVSVALYGYRNQLFIGLSSDEALMPDVDAFKVMIERSFAELAAAVTRGAQ